MGTRRHWMELSGDVGYTIEYHSSDLTSTWTLESETVIEDRSSQSTHLLKDLFPLVVREIG